ncbi:MAG: hypothetical protein JSW23_01175 [Planctomycetota bacterium]|nr:MAG: hypothetical protein JSW23_01175 [Planctomycetota bacterium]
MFTRKTNMITTFRIITAIAVFAVAVFFVFTVAFGVHSDAKAEQFLNSPSAIEKFNRAKAEKPADTDDRSSPLVKQAEAFARYLNPPPKPQPRPAAPRQAAGRPRPPAPVSSKFDLIGTSYYELRPELSLALIDEPGKGLRWVRQSAEVGHLIIDQVKDGLVVVRDGQRTFELLPERPKKTSLVRHATPPDIPGKTTRRPPPASHQDTEQSKALKAALAELEAVKRIMDSEEAYSELSPEEETYIEDMFTELENAVITGEEAERIDRLGRELRELWSSRNQAEPNKTQSDASDLNQPETFDANLIEPNSPT